MSDKMRWRYGDTNPVVVDQIGEWQINIGDLLFLDEDSVPRRAADFPSQGSEAETQAAFVQVFLGVAMQRILPGDTKPIRVATTGVFEMDCPSTVFALGDYVGVCLNESGHALMSQQVNHAPDNLCAIGRAARGNRNAGTSVLVDIRSTLMTGGVTRIESPTSQSEGGMSAAGGGADGGRTLRVGRAGGRRGPGGCRRQPGGRTLRPPSQNHNHNQEETPIVRAIKYRELKRMYEVNGPEKTVQHLREALEQGHLKPEDFSLRELAEATLGGEWVRQLDPRNGGGPALLEAGDGVDATAFSHISGQLVYSRILDSYQNEAFVASRLVETIPTRMDGEKIAGIGALSDSAAEVHPGMPYPNAGFGEDYIQTPSTTKRGFIVPVTREAIFFDRTHLVLQRAAEVGETLGLNKEKRILDVILGLVNNFNWRDTVYQTYYHDGLGGPWINAFAEELVDWTNVNAAEQVLGEIVDPNSGEPVLVRATTALVMPAYLHTANRIFRATEINYTASGAATTTTAPNPLAAYQVVSSRLAYRRLVDAGVDAAQAKMWWYFGDFRKAFAYMENWPITVTQSAANSEADFNQDIVIRFKASERGTPAVLNPRYVVRSTGTTAVP